MKNFFLSLIFIYSTVSLSGSLHSQEEQKQPTVDITITSSSPELKVNIVDKKADSAEKKDSVKSAGKNDLLIPVELGEYPISGVWLNFKNWIHRYIDYEKFAFWDIFYLFIGIFLSLIIGRIVRWFIENHAKKLAFRTKSKVDDLIFTAIGKPVSLLIFTVGFFLSSWPITSLMTPGLKEIFARTCLALGAASIAWGIYRLVTVIDHILTVLAQRTDNNLDDLIVSIIRKSLKITIVLVSVLFIGQNILNLNITTLLAGAGVMGLAIAFAAQDTIANFFGSIMIILDQPFKVGDCVSVSGHKGNVENVGFRSTRIRTFDGHLVTLPNKSVANADIENIAKRPFIKHNINLGLTYDTGYKQMEKAVELLHKLLDSQKCIVPERMPRIVFDKFNDYSLNISIIVWWHHRDENGNIISPDYAAYMKWVHETDMEILRIFDAEGLEFAFPTNTTYLTDDKKRKLEISK